MKILLAAIALTLSTSAFAECDTELMQLNGYAMYVNAHDTVPAAQAKRMVAKHAEYKAEYDACRAREKANYEQRKADFKPYQKPEPKVGVKAATIIAGFTSWGKAEKTRYEGDIEVWEYDDGRVIRFKHGLANYVYKPE